MGAKPAPSSINENHSFLGSPLYYAIRNGDSEITSLLINSGAALDRDDMKKQSYLALSLEQRNPDVTRALLEAGAKPYGVSDSKRRIIRPALQPLLKQAYDRLPGDDYIELARVMGMPSDRSKLAWPDAEKIYLLVDNLAKPANIILATAANDPVDPKIQAAFVDAIRFGRINDIQRGLDRGVALNPEPPAAQPLFEAIKNHSTSDTRVLDMLLKAGADPEIVNGEKQTPLIVAAQLGKAAAVKRLLAVNVHPHTRDNQGKNALHHAVEAIQYEAAEALLSAPTNRADPNGLTLMDLSPLDLAIGNTDQAMVTLLQTHGATVISEETKKWANLETRPNIQRYGQNI